MLISMGVDPDDPDIVDLDDDIISTDDVSTAFLVCDEYGADETLLMVWGLNPAPL